MKKDGIGRRRKKKVKNFSSGIRRIFARCECLL